MAFRGTRSAFGATFEAADKFGWNLVHPVSANPNPSGIVTDEAFEQITAMILDAVDIKGPIDGVLLHLHGAMVSESHEDAEGEFLARLRRRLGPDVPVVVTLDLHANVTPAHGRQCERADRLSHLPAYRPARAGLAGRRAARAGNAGRDPAQDRDRPPSDDLRARPRPHAARADGRADRPRRGARAERRGAGGQHLRRLQPRQYP